MASAAIIGLLVLTLTCATLPLFGLEHGLWALDLEIGYGLGCVLLLSGLGLFCAVAAARQTWRNLQARIDLGRVIKAQQAEIQATSQALDQQLRRAAILEERQRLARDMHDGIGGRLASLLARVRAHRIDLPQMEGELSEGLTELRLLVDSLDAAGETLAEALADFRPRARAQAEAARMSLAWEQPDDLDVGARDPRWILNLYRLMQEAVTNAVKHSGGDRLAVAIERRDAGTLVIRIEDNGRGYDRQALKAGRGLANMAYRARQLGAELLTEGAGLPSGARVTILLPILAGPPGALAPGQSSGEIMPN